MAGIEEARTFLPGWVVWGPLVVRLPLVFLISFVIARLATIILSGPLRRAGDQPWPDRARLAYPVRKAARPVTLLLTLFPIAFFSATDGHLCPIPGALRTILTGFVGYSGSAIAFFFAERKLRRGLYPFGAWVRGVLLTWLLLFPHLLLMLLLVLLMPPTFNSTAVGLFITGAGLFLFFGVGGGFFIARLLGLVRPAPPPLRDLVEETSGAMGIGVRAVYVIPAPVANAFALPLLRCLAFTSQALEILSDKEVSAIAAHELAHLSESRLAKMSRLVVLLACLPLVVIVPLVHSFREWWWPVAGILLGLILTVRFVLRLSRRLERRADSLAVEQQHDPKIFANALSKLYEANLAPVVEPGKGLLHPHLYDRLVAAGSPPEYARPRPPSQFRVRLSFGLAVILVCGSWLVLRIPLMIYSDSRHGDERASLISLALSNGSATTLSNHAYIAWGNHQFVESAALYRAVCETDATSFDPPANAALLLAYLERCDEAEQMLHEAERRRAAGGRGAKEQIDAVRQVLAECKLRHMQRPRGLPAE
jgi:Zn-dependent protease with chaperone function